MSTPPTARVVYKHPVGIGYTISILLPVLSSPLSVSFQHAILCMWVEQPYPVGAMEMRYFRAYTAGETFDPKGSYRFIGTCISDDDSFVVHVYEISKEDAGF